MKRILTIQDISCVGKCSLTVALPILSAMGIEAAVIPTAVLSTHTAFKEGYTCCDLTGEIAPIVAHWKREGITFDAIYTGYLASIEQIALVKEVFAAFPEAMTFVDPAMADNGKLYPAFNEEFAHEMASLCAIADVVTPNLTEAAFMTGLKYPNTLAEETAFVEDALTALAKMGAGRVVLTGISDEREGKRYIGVTSYARETGERTLYLRERIPAAYHGTGDIYASAALGALLNGFAMGDALRIAADYTAECIRLTVEDPNGRWYGVNFEEAIPSLLRAIGR